MTTASSGRRISSGVTFAQPRMWPRSTPQTAVVLAVQHSGSVRYYANRITLRYDWLADDHLDVAIQDLTARGYHPFLVLDDWEETEFRNRFAPHSRMGKLDWPPLARVKGNPEVRIYDLGNAIK